MKLTSILLLSLLFSSILFSQEPNEVEKIKVKAKQKRLRYHLVPEFAGYDDYTSFNYELTDNGEESFRMSGDKTMNPEVLNGKRILGDRIINKVDQGHFTIKINRTSTRLEGRKTEKRQKEGQPAYYRISFSQKDEFEIQLVDNKKDGEVLMDTTVVINYNPKFPENFLNGKTYSSAKSVEDGYKAYIKNNTMSKTLKVVRSKRLAVAFNNEAFEEVFEGKFGSNVKLVFLQTPKIKEKKTSYFADFERVTEIYDEVLDILPGGLQAHTSVNFHDEKVYTLMDEAYNLLLPFEDKKYSDAIEDKEERQEFVHLLRYSLFLTSFATSRYDEAKKHMSSMASDLGKEYEQLKGYIPSKYSDPKQKYAHLASKDFYVLLERESRLYNGHKDEYGYFK